MMRNTTIMILLILSIPIFLMLNLMMGSVSIPTGAVIGILMGNDAGNIASCGVGEVWTNIVMHTRLPQTVTAIACGSGLAVAGLLMQTIFHNPLAGPSVLGISTAASLGVAFVVLLSGALGGNLMTHFGILGNTALTVAAIIGSLVAMAIIMALSRRVRGNVTLLIVGVMIGYIASAITGVLKFFSSEEEVRAYVVWGLGSFARVTGGQVYVFAGLMAVMLPLTMLLVKPLNLLLLGEQYAMNLGLNVSRSRMAIIFAAGTLTAITTAYCGPIMFIGLAVPHIARGLFRTQNHRVILPATLLCGASLALICNLIARLPGLEGALPVNSVTALIGAPVALYVLLHRQRRY